MTQLGKSDWRRSIAGRLKGLPQDVLERLLGDERLMNAIQASNLEEVQATMLAHRQRVQDELTVFRSRQSERLNWLADHLDPRYYGLDVEELEQLMRSKEMPHASRDELFELAWFVGDIREMEETIMRMNRLIDEAATLLGVERSDQQAQAQVSRRTVFRKGE